MNHDWQPLPEHGFMCAGCGARSRKGTAAGECSPRPAFEPSKPAEPRPEVDVEQLVAAAGDSAGEVWGLLRRATSLAREVTRWALAGCPIRSVDEQRRIVAICRACPLVRIGDAGGVGCSICGCRAAGRSLSPEDHGLKIKLATTRCPDSPARW
jgi:hypothetical protein